MFINSLFSFHGSDTHLRFLCISSLCYLVLFISYIKLESEFIIISLFAGLLLQLTSYRRGHDINDNYIFCHLTLIPFFIILLSLSLNFGYWTILIFLLTVLPISYPLITNENQTKNNDEKNYIYGYWHPDFLLEQKLHSNRIEPTWNSETILIDEFEFTPNIKSKSGLNDEQKNRKDKQNNNKKNYRLNKSSNLHIQHTNKKTNNKAAEEEIKLLEYKNNSLKSFCTRSIIKNINRLKTVIQLSWMKISMLSISFTTSLFVFVYYLSS